MSGFDTCIMVDWSASATPSPAKPCPDSIWIGVAQAGEVTCSYHRTRSDAMAFLTDLLQAELDAGRRVLAGFDFPFAYPAGFARQVTGSDDPLVLWQDLAQRVEDDDTNANNRWHVAATLNDLFPGLGPFWGCPSTVQDPRLPHKGTARQGHGMPERRQVESMIRSTQPCWKLYTTGSVGSQALLGIPRLQALRMRFGDALSVRPFEDKDSPIVLAEIFPSLIADTVAQLRAKDEIKDRAQVRVLAGALAQLDPARLERLTRDGDPIEGWILGIGHEEMLDQAAWRAQDLAPDLQPPRLRDDCFAMPQGVDWVPVDAALERLRDVLVPISGVETVPTAQAGGRVLAKPVIAQRSNPPQPNSAVDGYGFAHAATGSGKQTLPLVQGRAAAGQPYEGQVPLGSAIRILTGAVVPDGVDTVVLEEDTATDGVHVVFDGPVKPNANTRKAGEDVPQGAPALPAGHQMRAPDLALLSALGVGHIPVYRRLRVGVLSTGDEIIASPDLPALPHQIWDANRPMLLQLARDWGYDAVDLGHAQDDADAIAGRLSDGAAQADVIVTSGGASAGDEDHVSALLRSRGTLSSWRIALKPGRPLALALWDNTPVFGLPGNPVAALVCALIFARPAFSQMAGAGWQTPLRMTVPAAFAKRKKPGRREYLRARLTPEGAAEVFKSEGSGRISGLSWATGLVELPDAAVDVSPGDPVVFLPYSGFGLH